ncbi:HAD domain-containing protein [Nonomuraea sp. ZG12]|uniref:HAD domain-containing protein n=1 Tax=Nonomuraea sp. ZG12 TaxID=3452207 RepID=UPI003F8A6BDD
MTGSVRLPLLFLDVDGPLIPFGATPRQHPEGYPTHEPARGPRPTGSNPLLSRIDPAHGRRLAALPCELVWATTWMDDANECVSPWIGLSRLPVVVWPEPSAIDDQDEREGIHWKTRSLVGWAAGRPFAWVDDEISDIDRVWVSEHHRGRALLHRVDPSRGLVETDYAALNEWMLEIHGL